MNNFAMLQALAFEPRRAFEAMAERPRSLFPLLLVALCSVGLVLWFYKVVDLAWLTDRTMRSGPLAGRLTEAQIEAQVSAAGSNPMRAGVIAAVFTCFALVIIRLLEAVYFLLAGKITNVQRSFGQWFALSCWTSVPSVLAAIPSAIVLLMATSSQMDQGELQPLSLNALFFRRAFDEPGFSLLTSINLLHFVALYLAALGVRTWSGRSWTFSIVFASLPWALIVGVWAFLAMGRS